MVKLGWMQDMHIHHDDTFSAPGPRQRFVDDANRLINTHNVEDIYLTGDMVHGRPKGRVPHTVAEDYDQFWNLVSQTDDPDRFRAAVPGNHEAPLRIYLDSDDRAALRKRVDYADDGLSVFLVNTSAPSWITGNEDTNAGVNTGVGTTVPRMPYADIEWLDEQLADADNQGYAKLILPHGATYLTPPGADEGNGTNGNLSPGDVYWVCTNYKHIHSIISQYSDVAVAFSHLYQFGSGNETSYTVDGVDYVSTQHYYNASSDSLTTYGIIDADSGGITITTEQHGSLNTFTPLDATYSGSDTTAPSISGVSLSSDGSGGLSFSFDSSEQLATIAVTVDGPSTTDVYSFTETDFSESGTGPYTYTLSTIQAYDDGDGIYTATVDDAIDSAGNNGGVNGSGSGLSDSYDYSSGGSYSSLPSSTQNYWPADEGSGTTVADFQASNDITLESGVSWVSGAGAGGYHLEFDGSNNSYATATSTPITGSQNRTLGAWVNLNTNDADLVLSNWGTEGSNGRRYTLYTSRSGGSNGLRIEVAGDGYTSALVPATNSWVFVALVLDGSTLGDHTLYLDGSTESASGTLSIDTGSDIPFEIGGNTVWDDSRLFNGSLGEFFITNDAMSTSELDQYRNDTKSRYGL